MTTCYPFRFVFFVVLLAAPAVLCEDAGWPEITPEQRPGAYWWWMGSAVNEQDLSRQLEQYKAAGMGGVHIIPIYGAKGYEEQYVEYLSPRWMALLAHTTSEAARIGLFVDMTTGTGWCFGGPNVPEIQGCADLDLNQMDLKPGKIPEVKGGRGIQAVVARESGGEVVELDDKIGDNGRVDWEVPDGEWKLYIVRQKTANRMVKRAAPGGEGHMLNPFYGAAIRNYVQRFDAAFEAYKGRMPRAMYHDSYEYKGDWAPNLFAGFERRRGYRLQKHIPVFAGVGTPDEVARVKCDYRETLSDMLVEDFTAFWVDWAHDKGCRTRDQAHGSPGNLLDLYALNDMPETEMFNKDRDPLVAKFASSAAHVMGRKRVACETGTWLREHFTVTLADLKDLLDELFVSGVNHVIYHGTCYSPAVHPWPGWCFYASTEMNPRNSIWQDAPALNEYIARCQAVFQNTGPANDILLYWPVYDLWHDPGGTIQQMTVHHTGWLTEQPIGDTARQLWDKGYTFDYISDRLLKRVEVVGGKLKTPGGNTYEVVLVPPCTHMPVATAEALAELAASGAVILCQDHLPQDVPGLARLDARRAQLAQAATVLAAKAAVGEDLDALLNGAGVKRETMVDLEGVEFIRRNYSGGHYYFIANQGTEEVAWYPGLLAAPAQGVALMDPMTGAIRQRNQRAVFLSHAEPLEPGRSLIVRTFADQPPNFRDLWEPLRTVSPVGLPEGPWQVEFVQGGPELPASFTTERPAAWTKRDDPEAKRFAGTARYTLRFPWRKDTRGQALRLDLGRVAESARVKLNITDLGTLFAPPFHVDFDPALLKPEGNVLEVYVTNVSANRIRDLDRRGVEWRKFHNINFVNLNYKPFDASQWPIRESGLLGPVKMYLCK